MATYINDLTSNVLGTVADHFAGTTGATTGNTRGTSGDFVTTQGQCTLIQSIGNMFGNTPRIQTKVQESTDGTTWTDVTGASLAVTGTSQITQPRLVTFTRTKRYLACYNTVDGTGNLSIWATNLIVAQKQQV